MRRGLPLALLAAAAAGAAAMQAELASRAMAQPSGPSSPCLVRSITGSVALDLTGGVGVGEGSGTAQAGLEHGTGLTVTGERMSNLNGRVTIAIDQSDGPMVTLGLDGQAVGSEGAGSGGGGTGDSVTTVTIGKPSVDVTAKLQSSIAAAREWDFPTIPATQAFLNQAGSWYAGHSYVFLPVLADLVTPDDQFPQPDQTWLTLDNSLSLESDAAVGLLQTNASADVPLSTLTDSHFIWATTADGREPKAIVTDFQIPALDAPSSSSPLSPAAGISGTLELIAPIGSDGLPGPPDTLSISYDTTGSGVKFTAGIGPQLSLSADSQEHTSYTRDLSVSGSGGGTSTVDATHIDMSLDLKTHAQLRAVGRFLDALESQDAALPAAEQALLAAIAQSGELTVTGYRVESSDAEPIALAGTYDLLAAGANVDTSQVTSTLTGAVWWDQASQSWRPWTSCLNSPGAAPLHLKTSIPTSSEVAWSKARDAACVQIQQRYPGPFPLAALAGGTIAQDEANSTRSLIPATRALIAMLATPPVPPAFADPIHQIISAESTELAMDTQQLAILRRYAPGSLDLDAEGIPEWKQAQNRGDVAHQAATDAATTLGWSDCVAAAETSGFHF